MAYNIKGDTRVQKRLYVDRALNLPEWIPNFNYVKLDLFIKNNQIFKVLDDYTSPTVFDASDVLIESLPDTQTLAQDLVINANMLQLKDGVGNDLGTPVDLTLYLDDSNLARIVSGTINAAALATFTRDDATTFTVDFSALLSDLAFTGATAIVAGIQGDVPAPAAGDEDKYLAGDGTWKVLAVGHLDDDVETVTGTAVDNTDPRNPVIHSLKTSQCYQTVSQPSINTTDTGGNIQYQFQDSNNANIEPENTFPASTTIDGSLFGFQGDHIAVTQIETAGTDGAIAGSIYYKEDFNTGGVFNMDGGYYLTDVQVGDEIWFPATGVLPTILKGASPIEDNSAVNAFFVNKIVATGGDIHFVQFGQSTARKHITSDNIKMAFYDYAERQKQYTVNTFTDDSQTAYDENGSEVTIGTNITDGTWELCTTSTTDTPQPLTYAKFGSETAKTTRGNFQDFLTADIIDYDPSNTILPNGTFIAQNSGLHRFDLVVDASNNNTTDDNDHFTSFFYTLNGGTPIQFAHVQHSSEMNNNIERHHYVAFDFIELNENDNIRLLIGDDAAASVTFTQDLFRYDVLVTQLPTSTVVMPDALAVEDNEVIEYARTGALTFGNTYSLDNFRTWQNLIDDYAYIQLNYSVKVTGVAERVTRTITTSTKDFGNNSRSRFEYGVAIVDFEPSVEIGGDWVFSGNSIDDIVLEIVGIKAQKTVINTTDLAADDQASSGYMDIGSMRMQWGSATGDGARAVTFPAPFANTNYIPTVTAGFAGGAPRLASVNDSALSTTGMTVIALGDNGLNSTAVVYWQAIGLKPN